MRVELYQGPLDAFPLAVMPIAQPLSISEILAQPDIAAPDWFHEFGVVRVGGEVIPQAWWPHVRVKPGSADLIELCVVPQRGALSTVLAVVAAAATIAIGTFGLPFLGIAAGSLWANVIAAGIGIAAQLAIRALTAAPVADNQAGAGGVQKVQAGISSNTPVMNDTLPVVFGKMGFSPPHLMPPYTTYSSVESRVIAVLGFEGPAQINKVLINGQTVDKFPGALVETRAGFPGDAPRTIGAETVIERRVGQLLSNFDTLQKQSPNDPLKHQPLNAVDVPQWHGFKTEGTPDDFTIRLSAPSGFVDSGTPSAKIKLPLRIQIRRKGDATWRNLPEIHLQDVLHGTGPWRTEIRCKFARPPGGQMICRNDAWNVWSVSNIAGKGTFYEWQADAYFVRNIEANSDIANGSNASATASGILPIATGPTTSGFTFSASSSPAGNEAWRCATGRALASLNAPWATAANALPVTWTVQLPSAQTVKSYAFWGSSSSAVVTDSRLPTAWQLLGSIDGVNWTLIDTVEATALGFSNFYQVGNPAAYSYYRFIFTKNNGSANNDIAIGMLRLFASDQPCMAIASTGEYIGYLNSIAVHQANNQQARCTYASLDQDGVTFYLDPAQWPTGEYEINMMRGVAVPDDGTVNPYTYSVGAATNGFFASVLSGGLYTAPYGFYYRTDLSVEVLQTHQAIAPFDPTGIALVAISVPDAQIESIYIEATRYGRTWNGAVWSENVVPMQNPASLYREVLLGAANAMPAPGEVIDEAELAAWYQTCAAKAYQCNAVVQGARVLETLQMIASAGYAAPRVAAQFGVVEDKDTTASPVRYVISPLNSKDLGSHSDVSNLPHVVRATFNDETDSYAQNQVMVYRDGYDATNAKLFEAITYTGHTSAAKVAARATFDLRQLALRSRKYVRQVGIEGLLYKRGMLMALNDDVISGNHAAGWISAVTYDSPTLPRNVVSITLDNVMPWSRASAIEAVGDIASLADILNPSVPMGVAIRLPNQDLTIRQITENVDGNTCTFVTPFPDDGSIVQDMLVIAGTMTDTHRRVKVFEKTAQGFETFTLTLVDEAPQLFA